MQYWQVATLEEDDILLIALWHCSDQHSGASLAVIASSAAGPHQQVTME